MADDCSYVESLSGEAGELAKATHNMAKSNGALTNAFDSIFSPDEVDAFDASCNTCKHFKRSPMTAEEKRDRNLTGMPGRCELKGVATKGMQRGIYCGFENRECYENRRTGVRPMDACKLALAE